MDSRAPRGSCTWSLNDWSINKNKKDRRSDLGIFKRKQKARCSHKTCYLFKCFVSSTEPSRPDCSPSAWPHVLNRGPGGTRSGHASWRGHSGHLSSLSSVTCRLLPLRRLPRARRWQRKGHCAGPGHALLLGLLAMLDTHLEAPSCQPTARPLWSQPGQDQKNRPAEHSPRYRPQDRKVE